VEALVSGPTDLIEQFIAQCTGGPAGACVQNIDLEHMAPYSEQGFQVKPTL
jgi:acylphosphatase